MGRRQLQVEVNLCSSGSGLRCPLPLCPSRRLFVSHFNTARSCHQVVSDEMSYQFGSPVEGRQVGFTFVEILVVVLILAVLAAVIIPNVSSFRTSGDLAAANKELAAVRTAADAYRSNQPDPDNGWPGNTNLPGFRQYYTGELRAIYYFDTDGSGIGKGLIERADTSVVVNPWPGTIHFSPDAQRWEQTRR